jgi:hypothetical protein
MQLPAPAALRIVQTHQPRRKVDGSTPFKANLPRDLREIFGNPPVFVGAISDLLPVGRHGSAPELTPVLQRKKHFQVHGFFSRARGASSSEQEKMLNHLQV